MALKFKKAKDITKRDFIILMNSICGVEDITCINGKILIHGKMIDKTNDKTIYYTFENLPDDLLQLG